MTKGRTVPPPGNAPPAGGEMQIGRHPAIPGLAREMAEDILQQGHDLPTTARVATNAIAFAERLVARFAADEHVACRAGCMWCCTLSQIAASPPEVIRIAQHLRATRTPDQLDALAARLRQREGRLAAMSPERRGRARLPCALLVDNRCSVYEIRPLACRGVTSSSADACEASYNSGWLRKIPNGGRHLGITVDVREGVGDGLAAAGLDGADLDLTIALRIVLETPDVAERWLAGEPVFASAHLEPAPSGG